MSHILKTANNSLFLVLPVNTEKFRYNWIEFGRIDHVLQIPTYTFFATATCFEDELLGCIIEGESTLKWAGKTTSPLFPFLLSFTHFSFPFPPFPSLSFPSGTLPVEVGPLNSARGSGERCNLPQCIFKAKITALGVTFSWVLLRRKLNMLHKNKLVIPLFLGSE